MALSFPNIDPVALAIGPLQIHWYALAYLVGFLLGWRYMLYLAARDPQAPSAAQIDDFLPWAIVGVILGGRLGYILFYQAELYLQNPLEMLKIWKGGMSFHGGTAGMIAAMIFYARAQKIALLRLTDLVCCAVPIGLFFGRIANFVNGELFGRITDKSWGVIFPYGGPDPRHPSQIYEALLEGALLFVILFVLAKRDAMRARPGLLSAVFLAGYACARIFVECFREPDAQLGYLFGYITMGQILCLPMLAGAAVLAVIALRNKRGAA